MKNYILLSLLSIQPCLSFADDFQKVLGCVNDISVSRVRPEVLKNENRILSTEIYYGEGVTLKTPAKAEDNVFFWTEEDKENKKVIVNFIDLTKKTPQYGNIKYPEDQKYAVVDVSGNDTKHYVLKLPESSKTFDFRKIDFRPLNPEYGLGNIYATFFEYHNYDSQSDFSDFGVKREGIITKYGVPIDRLSANSTKTDAYQKIKTKLPLFFKEACRDGVESYNFSMNEIKSEFASVGVSFDGSKFKDLRSLGDLLSDEEWENANFQNNLMSRVNGVISRHNSEMKNAGFLCSQVTNDPKENLSRKNVRECPLFQKCQKEAKSHGLYFEYIENQSVSGTLAVLDLSKRTMPIDEDTVPNVTLEQNAVSPYTLQSSFSLDCQSYIRAAAVDAEKKIEFNYFKEKVIFLKEEINILFDMERARLNCVEELSKSSDQSLKTLAKEWKDLSCIKAKKEEKHHSGSGTATRTNSSKSLR